MLTEVELNGQNRGPSNILVATIYSIDALWVFFIDDSILSIIWQVKLASRKCQGSVYSQYFSCCSGLTSFIKE